MAKYRVLIDGRAIDVDADAVTTAAGLITFTTGGETVAQFPGGTFYPAESEVAPAAKATARRK